MSTNEKIITLLQKITSQKELERIYRFIKYVYIHSR